MKCFAGSIEDGLGGEALVRLFLAGAPPMSDSLSDGGCMCGCAKSGVSGGVLQPADGGEGDGGRKPASTISGVSGGALSSGDGGEGDGIRW